MTCADKSAKGGALYHCSAWGDIQAGCTLLTGPSSRANIGPHSTELPERRAYRHQTRIPMGHRHVATVQVACSVLNAQGYRRKLAPNSQHHPPGRMTHTPFGPFLFFRTTFRQDFSGCGSCEVWNASQQMFKIFHSQSSHERRDNEKKPLTCLPDTALQLPRFPEAGVV